MALAIISGHEALQQVINALSLGSTYALLALGLAMVFSIVGLINFAHGQLVAIAGYALYLGHQAGLPFSASIGLAIVAAGLVAVLMDRIAFRPLRGAGFLTLLFSSFAVSVLIQVALQDGVSPVYKSVSIPNVANDVIRIGAFTIGWLQLVTFVTCGVVLIALTVFLRRSRYGLGMLAAREDFEITRLMGLAANRLIAGAFALSGVLAAIAGVFIVAQRGSVDPTMGLDLVIKAFIATVIGGLGSLSGAVLGGFVLGAIETGLDATLPQGSLAFRDAFSLIIVIAILYLRPQGLLTSRAEAG